MSASIHEDQLDLDKWARQPNGKLVDCEDWPGILTAAVSYRLGQIGQVQPPPSQVKLRLTLPAELLSMVQRTCEGVSRVVSATVSYALEKRGAERCVFIVEIALDGGRTFFDPPHPAAEARVNMPARPFAGE